MPWDDEAEDTTVYKVVINHEEQYSIWPVDRENPLGWNDATNGIAARLAPIPPMTVAVPVRKRRRSGSTAVSLMLSFLPTDNSGI